MADRRKKLMEITMSRENADFARNEELLRKLQLAELDILKKVTRAFEQNGLQYYLGYGTLLGAIRHQGFIPWDDDVDVFLPRPDFERFREIADQVLEPPLFLNRDPMPRPICLQHYMRIENPQLQQIKPKGAGKFRSNVRIDIFPIDGAPETLLGREWLFIRARILYELIRFPRACEDGVSDRGDRTLLERGMVWLNKHFNIGKHISAIKLAQKFDKLRRRYSYEDSEWVAAWVLDYGERIFCKKEWFGAGRKEMFEGAELNVPVNSEAVLHQYYGDFMTPPPEEKRILRHIVGFVEDGLPNQNPMK